MTDKQELTITVGNNDEIKATSAGGAEVDGALQLDPLRMATVQIFSDWLKQDKITKKRELEVLGQHLYYAIFNGKIEDQLNERLGAVGNKGRLRLQLKFEGQNKDLIDLPWEFLFSPNRRSFMATDVNLVLSRYLALPYDREPLAAEKTPLKILVVISKPRDEQSIIAKEVVAEIRSLSRSDIGISDSSLPDETMVQVETIEQPSLANLEKALKDHTPHILHFIGHGRKEADRAELALIDPDSGNASWCDDESLIYTFQQARVYPRLVFLHMCEGGEAAGSSFALEAFSGFAPKLINARIPSVVAMQYPIKNKDARDFSLAFYQKLAEGGTVDEAVQHSRASLGRTFNNRVFGTPVLYLHSSDGIILARKSGAGAEQAGSGRASDAPTQEAASVAPGRQGAAEPSIETFKFAFNLYNIGMEKLKEIVDQDSIPDFEHQLDKMLESLAALGIPEMGIQLFQWWSSEKDSQFKEVLQAMMNAYAQADAGK